MSNFKGIIIEESLKDLDVLRDVQILETIVEQVTEKHNTSWLKQWTMDTVEVSSVGINAFCEKLSKAIETKHTTWYADVKNEEMHRIVFANKVFVVNRSKPEQYEAVKAYGRKLGIPEHQLDFAS